jgi:type II secretion system protein H
MISKERIRAFTLLEVVLVLVITALLFGLVVLGTGVGGRSELLEHEGKRLKAICELAAQMAILQSQEIGAVFGKNSYAFVIHQDEQWRPLEGDSALRHRTLPEGYLIEAAAEGSLLRLDEQSRKSSAPQIIFFSNGEILPFEIYLIDEHSTRSLRLTGNLAGVLELSDPQPTAPTT